MKIFPHSRRAFLQGTAQTLLAVPFLPSLVASATQAQVPVSGPSRFVFVGAIFGRDIKAWYPREEPTQRSADGALYKKLSEVSGPLSYILNGSFDKVRNKISILRGLDCMQPGDGHATTVPLTASGGMPSGVGYGYSFDVVLEESRKFYASLPMASAIRTCPNQSWNQLCFSYTSSSAPKQALWHEWDPAVVYERYFNPPTVAARAQQAVGKRSVVNKVMEDYRRALSGPRIGREDKRRLDNYLALLTQAEVRLGVAPVSCTRGTKPAALGSEDQLHSAAIDLEVAALACGITRIVCHNILQVSSGPSGFDPHAEAHQQNTAKSDPSVTQHAIHNRWVMDKVAEFLGKLDAVEENGRTLLDDTVFLYGNAEARGFHTQFDMPVLIAGGGGKLRTGYYIDYRPRPLTVHNEINGLIAGRPYNHLLVTLFRALGLAPDEYQRLGAPGFGIYDQFDGKLGQHYAPFLKDYNAVLPFLLT